MEGEQPIRWVLVRSFHGLYQEIDADLLVTALRGHQVPVWRFPQQVPMAMLYRGMAAYGFPVQVYAPSEYAAEASELALEQTLGSVPPALRSIMQWYVAVSLLIGLLGGCATVVPAATVWQMLSWVPLVACEVWLVAAMWRFVVWLRHERPLLVNWGPVGAAVVAWAAVSLLGWVLPRVLHLASLDLADSFWQIAVGLVLIVLCLGLMRWGRR